jgi:hypothetical protein
MDARTEPGSKQQTRSKSPATLISRVLMCQVASAINSVKPLLWAANRSPDRGKGGDGGFN